MHKKIYTPGLLFFGWILTLPALAQDSTAVKKAEMADRFRADGKIYVVVAVVTIILLGLIGYVSRLDRKISKLEKEVK
ncbi:MAG TPA: CcmD family protein [Puia sp.]|jgi:CcmD family protein|nr:CcmD family protein [Puia sp.]